MTKLGFIQVTKDYDCKEHSSSYTARDRVHDPQWTPEITKSTKSYTYTIFLPVYVYLR